MSDESDCQMMLDVQLMENKRLRAKNKKLKERLSLEMHYHIMKDNLDRAVEIQDILRGVEK